MKNSRLTDVWLNRICHFSAIGLSIMSAFFLRFDLSVPPSITSAMERTLLIAILIKLPVFERAGFFRGLRAFASTPDLYMIFTGNLVASGVLAAVARFWFGSGVPYSVLMTDAILCFVITGFVRLSTRISHETLLRARFPQGRKGILIYGAGAAGAELVHEIHSYPRGRYYARGFLDDDPAKLNAMIMGVPVLGCGRDAVSIVRRLNRHRTSIEEIIIAIPSASGAPMREILANCRAANIPCKTVPRIEELISGSNTIVRNFCLQDLLGRAPIALDDSSARASIAGRSVLITGAAGSIGSELCRQVASFGPACLIAFDQAESELFRIGNELHDLNPDLHLVQALGDIRDKSRLAEVFDRHRVESVFHAAAYKHVPMMESHVIEAVRNNILGTWNLALVGREHNLRRLVMISSDKAVNAVCVMGATKRVCERIVCAPQPDPRAKGVSVRFGNVLGSSGSVVPIFQAQIAAGGPVRVTHPDARRYFMTISEAVSLVIQASTLTQGSEVFVLDMGEPIRIVELAENMIRLAGLVPYEDIDIQFTGLRPGERLIEELHGSGDAATAAGVEKIQVIHEQPLQWNVISDWIRHLEELVNLRQASEIMQHMRTLVPEYGPAPSSEQESEEQKLRVPARAESGCILQGSSPKVRPSPQTSGLQQAGASSGLALESAGTIDSA